MSAPANANISPECTVPVKMAFSYLVYDLTLNDRTASCTSNEKKKGRKKKGEDLNFVSDKSVESWDPSNVILSEE